jgi:hypothetical protein
VVVLAVDEEEFDFVGGGGRTRRGEHQGRERDEDEAMSSRHEVTWVGMRTGQTHEVIEE